VTLPLACTDADGEQLTRAISPAPAAGKLGAVDDGAGRVAYAAPLAAGTQTLRFTASDGANVSAPATITINVGAPPVSSPPPAPRVQRRLPKGRDVRYSRATGVDGKRETSFSNAAGSRARFTVT
jgi:hypothetical protein